MSLFGNGNEKILKKMLNVSNWKPQTKTITCPNCRRRFTVTFLTQNDGVTCKCGYKIYADEV